MVECVRKAFASDINQTKNSIFNCKYTRGATSITSEQSILCRKFISFHSRSQKSAKYSAHSARAHKKENAFVHRVIFTIVLLTVSFFSIYSNDISFWMLIVMPRNTKLVLLSYLGIHLAYTISSPTTDDDDEDEKIINKRAHPHSYQNVLQ